MNNSLFKAVNISRSYQTPHGSLEILKDLNFSVNKKEVVAICGVSGVGKSTLLHLLGTLDRPDQGSILLEERNLLMLSDKELNKFRCEKLGFVFQFHYLLSEFTALENVILPGLIKGESKDKIEERAKILLSKLNLKERFFHKPKELSFGEQQRVAIARSLINDPKIILADEPTGNLDSQTAREVFSLLYEIVKENHKI